jgi:hypothetical protein
MGKEFEAAVKAKENNRCCAPVASSMPSQNRDKAKGKESAFMRQ